MSDVKEHWKSEPEEHDFPAAVEYLELLMPRERADLLVRSLREAPTVRKKAKDLWRASRLKLLPPDNSHVARDLKKVAQGEKLSPVLLIRGSLDGDVPLTVADGYHRICASWHLDENAEVPCRIVDL